MPYRRYYEVRVPHTKRELKVKNMLTMERTSDGFEVHMNVGGAAFSSCDILPSAAIHDIAAGIVKERFDKYLGSPDLVLYPDNEASKKLIEKLDHATADGHQVIIYTVKRTLSYNQETLAKIIDGTIRPGVELEYIGIEFDNEENGSIGYWFYRNPYFPGEAYAKYNVTLDNPGGVCFTGCGKTADICIDNLANSIGMHMLDHMSAIKCEIGDRF